MEFYFATLGPGSPGGAMGLYQHGTGICKYYSGGGQWFYEINSGKPAFYLADGVPYLPDGRVASLDADLSPIKLMAKKPSARAVHLLSLRHRVSS